MAGVLVALVAVVAVAVVASAAVAPPAYAADPPRITLDGTAVTGATTTSQAPELGTGVWLTDSPTGDESRWFLVPRTHPGSTIRVGAALQPGQGGAGIGLALVTVQSQHSCGSASGTTAYGDAGSTQLLTLAVGSRGDDLYADCLTDDALLLELTASGEPDRPRSTPVRLVVSEEPAVKDAGSLPPPATSPVTWTDVPATGSADKVAPGHAFAGAPLLEDGFHAASVRPGEVQLFRVHLDWSQALETELRVPAVGEDSAVPGATTIHLRLCSPVLEPAGAAAQTAGGDSLSDDTYAQTGDEGRARAATPPVRYRNTGADDSDVRPASLPGDYYVVVSMDPVDPDTDEPGAADAEVPYQLVVERTGHAGAGAPAYDGGRLVIGGQTSDGPGAVRLATAGVLAALGLGCLGGSAVLLTRRARGRRGRRTAAPA